jgi:Phosphotransferase enzyme family
MKFNAIPSEINSRRNDPLLERLRETGRVRTAHASLEPLSGGVSSEICLVRDGRERFVIKRALPKLRVRDDWFADPARNAVEKACLDYLESIQPGCVPRVLFHDPEFGLFGMEYLDARFANWKTELLEGRTREEDAVRAGALLGLFHRQSWGRETVARRFDTGENFYALRLEPYLVTAGRRNPVLEPFFVREVERLRGAALALVHGDYSPKNILLNPERLVVLDCEVAWFGDPVFDLAFLLNHLLLKSAHRPDRGEDYLRLLRAALEAYEARMAGLFTRRYEERTGRLLLMLLLARVDGKSPVEYLTDERKKDTIRSFVKALLPQSVFGLDEIVGQWRARLNRL